MQYRYVALAAFVLAGCTPPQEVLPSAQPTPQPAPVFDLSGQWDYVGTTTGTWTVRHNGASLTAVFAQDANKNTPARTYSMTGTVNTVDKTFRIVRNDFKQPGSDYVINTVFDATASAGYKQLEGVTRTSSREDNSDLILPHPFTLYKR